MKTMKSKTLVVVFMLLAMLSYGNRLNEASPKLSVKKVRVVFKNVKKGHLLTIKNKQGMILHSETVSKEGDLSKIYDFSNLTDGEYVFELEKDFEIEVKSFKVENSKVIMHKNTEKVIFKPVIRSKNDLLLVSKISFDERPTQIVLFFEGKKIYSETANSNSTILNRVYKLDASQKGDYKIVIYSDDRNYSKYFKI